jgi:chromodomain-helicase-DNA-binding protein 7
MVQEYEMYYRNEKGIPGREIPKFNVLITTFEIVIADCMELKEFNWRLCVIDEAHRLKNRNCKLIEGLRLLNLVSLCVVVYGCVNISKTVQVQLIL